MVKYSSGSLELQTTNDLLGVYTIPPPVSMMNCRWIKKNIFFFTFFFKKKKKQVVWFIGSFSLPTGIFREKKKSWLFYFLFPSSSNNNRLSSLTRFYRLHTPAFYYTFPPTSLLFLCGACDGDHSGVVVSFVCWSEYSFWVSFSLCKKRSSLKIKWNKLSVFLFFSP